jgi:serine/tyrosine/threonine adenylyltransferase
MDKAEEGDSMVGELLDLLRHPYEKQPDKENFAQTPEWAQHRPGSTMLSCSS